MSECKWCNGEGMEYIGEGMSKVCPKCHGSGEEGSIVLSAEQVQKLREAIKRNVFGSLNRAELLALLDGETKP